MIVHRPAEAVSGTATQALTSLTYPGSSKDRDHGLYITIIQTPLSPQQAICSPANPRQRAFSLLRALGEQTFGAELELKLPGSASLLASLLSVMIANFLSLDLSHHLKALQKDALLLRATVSEATRSTALS